MLRENNILMTEVLSGVVFAALITSFANLIVTLINNRRIKIIEQQKNMTEIERYRYVHLYEILLTWHNYDSDIEGETPEEIEADRLLREFPDNVDRYNIIRPLLDEQFIGELDKLKEQGDKLLNDLRSIHTENSNSVTKEYLKNGVEFSGKLKDTINQQLKILMMKS